METRKRCGDHVEAPREKPGCELLLNRYVPDAKPCSSVIPGEITCIPHTTIVKGGVEHLQPIHSEFNNISQFNSSSHAGVDEGADIIFISNEWDDMQSEEIVETSSNFDELVQVPVQSQYNTDLIQTQSTGKPLKTMTVLQVESREFEMPNNLTPPLSTSSVTSNEAVDMSQVECTSSEIEVPTSSTVSNEPPWDYSSQPGCSTNSIGSFAEINIKCVKLEKLLHQPQLIKQESNNEDVVTSTEWSQMNEEIDIPFQNESKDHNNMLHANQIKKHQQQANQPKFGILDRQTYAKANTSFKIKCSKRGGKQESIPYSKKMKSNIKMKTSYEKNEVKFTNEDNELIVCKYNLHTRQNFDNLASKKFPQLTVQLVRLENTEIDISEPEFRCNSCFIVFNSSRKLESHIKNIECTETLSKLMIKTEEESVQNASADTVTDQSICEKGNTDLLTSKSISKKIIKVEKSSSSNVNLKTNMCPKTCTKNNQKDDLVNAIDLISKSKNDNFDAHMSFFCKICCTSFINVDALVIHKMKYHFDTTYRYIEQMFQTPKVKSEIVDEDSTVVKREDVGITAPKINVCYICGFKAVTTCHLEFHMKSHVTVNIKQDDTKIKSNKCAIPFSTKVSETSEKVERLNLFNYKNHSWKQMLISHDSKQKVLYKISKSKSKVTYNHNNRNTTNIKSVPRYVCSICNNMYRGLHSFNDHAVRAHIAVIGQKDLLKIIYIDPMDDPLDRGYFGRKEKKYKCHVCGLQLKSKSDAQNHMITNHCDSDSD